MVTCPNALPEGQSYYENIIIFTVNKAKEKAFKILKRKMNCVTEEISTTQDK